MDGTNMIRPNSGGRSFRHGARALGFKAPGVALFTALMLVFSLGFGCSSQQDAPGGGTEVQEVDPAAARQLLDQRTVGDAFVILDVRTPAEFASERIAGATNIDFRSPDFRERVAALDRDATYFVYCRSGNRSGQSLSAFRELGFRHIQHLSRGINAWKAAGAPTVSG